MIQILSRKSKNNPVLIGDPGVGKTAFDEYHKRVEKDAALARRFQPVLIDEPTVEDTISILRRRGCGEVLDEKLNVRFTMEHAAAS